MKLTHLLIPAAVVAAGLFAQQGPPQGAPPVTEVKAYLSLTDSQITSLTQLRQQEPRRDPDGGAVAAGQRD